MFFLWRISQLQSDWSLSYDHGLYDVGTTITIVVVGLYSDVAGLAALTRHHNNQTCLVWVHLQRLATSTNSLSSIPEVTGKHPENTIRIGFQALLLLGARIQKRASPLPHAHALKKSKIASGKLGRNLKKNDLKFERASYKEHTETFGIDHNARRR